MLHEPEIRAIVRLLGEVSISSEDLSQKKRCLISRLCELIDGDRWAWSLNRRADKKRKALCLDSMSGSCPIAPLPDRSPTLAVASLSTRNSLAKGQASEAKLTLTVRQISEGVVSSISIVRRPGRPPFTPREIKMAQIVLSEIPWLHEQNPSVKARQIKISLSPRKRATFIYMVEGLNRKAIAERLRISPNTVHGYIKSIYEHYRVNSRAGLLKQFTLIGGEGLNR